MKKGTPTEAVLIEKVFDLVKDYEGDPVDLLESVTRKVLKYQREIQEGLLKKNMEKIKELADEIFEFGSIRIDNPNTHGTGCTLSSAIASNLAKGYDLETSVQRAKDYISEALGYMLDLGQGSGPMNHAFDLTGEFAE